VALEHTTTYRFDRLVGLAPHVIRLRPAPHSRTPIEAYSLTITPANHFINWQQDPYGNHLARVVFPERTTELSITVDLIADLTVINPFDFFVEDYAASYPFSYPHSLAADLRPYLTPIAANAESSAVASWAAAALADAPAGSVNFLAELNRRVAADVRYAVRLEAGVQTPDETLHTQIGSCRDSAWLLVAILRELGLAARFVSGYLIQLAPDDPSSGGPAEDFTDLHAWAEVYLPGAGWIGLDATSGLFAGEGHIPLSATPNPAESAAVTGAVDFCQTTMEYSNVVRRFDESPRSTRPYTEQQWADVIRVGAEVDERLRAGDVRLTIGGEPTFVSAEDAESAQWNTAADGADKRAKAFALARRLQQRYARHGLRHHGQGKWYPGEALPRWQIALTWRVDGQPLWNDEDLLDDPWREPDRPATLADAEALAIGVAERLGIRSSYVHAAYEDQLARLTAEARVPDGQPPSDPRLGPPEARLALIEEIDAATEAVGWVLPVHRREDGLGWATAAWRFRRGRLVLLPGSSPIGLRLPLDSIAWTPPSGRPELSPFSAVDPLPDRTDHLPADASVTPLAQAPTTALAVEPRGGHLFLFLPPLEEFPPAVELLAAVEAAAAAIGRPIVVEGYPLPPDPRTRTLTVTPDPGVVEVNVQPVGSWPELVENTTALDSDARQCGLTTEKFALDGTHTGTGGGSHLTLGGATPADSPLLRRPSLLISMLTYWQHHPSLSYLFSGRFIGPTSQAPRVDEARHEYLYELEIAFAELDRLTGSDGTASPWMVDRALRHLLTDITGNTHRAEFCIDKLYSPDSARGRLGLLELRGFEMPPNPRMSLVQALLVRALVARFWEQPYRGALVRWGAGLHDRFLLPAFVADDIADVVADLRAHGTAFDLDWLEPFLEFRFPKLGDVKVGPVTLELRSAIEPWHVLGEEATGSGTARYVDSSVERVQVCVTGVVPERHVVTCNQIAIPLRPTGRADVLAAGVRFKAWSPPSALHPTIDIQAPLVFDVIDTWNGRSLGGCVYHVVHPGGRAFEHPPVNAYEAEARRSSRFAATGHTPGPVTATTPEPNPEYPYTLDLRRVAR